MPENQRHGIDWENDIKTKVFGLSISTKYTSVHDVDKAHNKYDINENISIKTTGRTTVDLGDALRVFRYRPSEKHTGIVVAYAQRNDEKVLSKVYEIDLRNSIALWGSIIESDIRELDALIKSIPSGGRNADVDRLIREKKRELNKKSGSIHFNPKIDSKSQRRLQCSIPHFSKNNSIITSVTTEPVVRGVVISKTLSSGKRIRNNRVQETGSLVLG